MFNCGFFDGRPVFSSRLLQLIYEAIAVLKLYDLKQLVQKYFDDLLF